MPTTKRERFMPARFIYNGALGAKLGEISASSERKTVIEGMTVGGYARAPQLATANLETGN
jgi:hypothetical protein